MAAAGDDSFDSPLTYIHSLQQLTRACTCKQLLMLSASRFQERDIDRWLARFFRILDEIQAANLASLCQQKRRTLEFFNTQHCNINKFQNLFYYMSMYFRFRVFLVYVTKCTTNKNITYMGISSGISCDEPLLPSLVLSDGFRARRLVGLKKHGKFFF